MYDFSRHGYCNDFCFNFFLSLIRTDFFASNIAWPFHIILDFFTHSIEYFPTPILWPISDYKFDGIPWSNKLCFWSKFSRFDSFVWL